MMDDCHVQLGNLARFDCRVCAYPDPEITWEKDGKVVKPNDHFELINTNDDIFSLLIKSVQEDDGGRYTCLAKNEFGEARTEALLNVIVPKDTVDKGEIAPSFVTKFYDVECTEGVPIEFMCIIAGKPDPSVTWLHNGKEIKMSYDVTTRRKNDQCLLAFRLIQLIDSGEITCVLKNALGEARCKAGLVVREDILKFGVPPLFVREIADTDTTVGDSVTFKCEVEGDPEPKVTWYFNRRELFESKRRIIKHDGTRHSLTLRDVYPSNEGEYIAKAVNVADEAETKAWLSVYEPRDKSPSPISYGLRPELKKEYGFPPSFTRRLADARVQPGENAYFECRTIGVPEPDVEWYKDGKLVTGDNHIEVGRDGPTAFLTVYNATDDDMGEYLCTIYNDAGKATNVATLTVRAEKKREIPRYSPERYTVPEYVPLVSLRDLAEDKIPTIPVDKPVLLEVRNDSVKLSWLPAYTSGLPDNAGPCSYIVEARKLPSNRWSRLGSDIFSTTFFARDLSPDKEYDFRIRAENRFGYSEPTVAATLHRREEPKHDLRYGREEILAPPVLPTVSPYITDMSEDTVRLSWKPPEQDYGRADLPPISYRLEAQVLPKEEWVPFSSRITEPNYYLSDLEHDRDYMFRVRAENKYGISEPTRPLWLPRAEAFPGIPISRPQIVDIEPDSVRLSWRRVNIPAFDLDEEPLLYMVEIQEPPSSDWRRIARHLRTTEYVVRDLTPGQDYRFRIRSESPDGDVGEPSPATSLYRSLAQSRVPIDRLEIGEYEPEYETVRLSWRKVDIPPYDLDDEPLTYMIEQCEPAIGDWRSLASGIPTTTYRIPGVSATDDYRFRVRALSPYGISPPSYPADMYRSLAPMRPLAESLQITDLQPEAVRLAWQPVSYQTQEPVRYQIEGLEPPSLEWRPLARDITDTSYRLTGLSPQRDYSFRVRAGDTEPTPPVSLTTYPVRPRLPVREPILSDIEPTSLQLSWRPAEFPIYMRQYIPIMYSVESQSLPDTDWVTIARRVPKATYLVTDLRPDRNYRFRVRPETEYGPGEYSLPVQLYRRQVLSLPPKEPVISDVTPESIMLSWLPARVPHAVMTPVTYRIESMEPPSGRWSTVATCLPSTSYPVKFLNPDRDYVFRIVAQADGVESEPTPGAYLPHRSGPPTMSSEIPYISDLQPDSLMLSWRSVELPSRITDYSPCTYRIEVLEGPLSDWHVLVRGVHRTQHNVTGLHPEREYRFRVRAENKYGLSGPTEPVIVKKRAGAPVLHHEEPIVSDIFPGSVRLSWRPAEVPFSARDSGPVNYTIFVQEHPDSTWQPYIRRIPYNSYSIVGLLPRQGYSFRIEAENDYGTSRPSMPVTLPRLPDYHEPADYPVFEDIEPSAIKLSWRRPERPSYDVKPITFAVERYRPIEHKWESLATRLPEPSYRVTDLDRYHENIFRLRMETEHGLGEPSLPISYSRRRVLPHVPVERPEIYDIQLDSVKVSWRPVYFANVPVPVDYCLEARELPNPNWRTLVHSTSDLSYEVQGLKPNSNYAFRVRSVQDDGTTSEPSTPVYLYRSAVIPHLPLTSYEIDEVEDDAINLKWKRVDIPSFDYEDDDLTFMIEGQQYPDYNWRPLARGITGTSHRLTGLEPERNYVFRIRGESVYGLTTPTPDIPLYRRPIRPGVPIVRPTIEDDEPYTARLRWQPAHIRPYLPSEKTTYLIEMQEPPRRQWRPIAQDVTTTNYQIKELSPRKDYLFRIRAKSPAGDISEPTPPIPYYKYHLSKYEPLPVYQGRPITEEYSVPNRPYIDSLTIKIPPRMPIEKPQLYEESLESVRLTWNAARVPAVTAQMTRTTYKVELRPQDCFDWREVTSGIVGQSYSVKNLIPYIDYAFRVRASNDFGYSEPTLPVFLNRPLDLRREEDEWDPDFGTHVAETVPPKLPFDSPKFSAVMPESLTLSWQPARIPAYAVKCPITYIVEVKEPLSTAWRCLAESLTEPKYFVTDLEPRQDYHFRIIAESKYGVSEPSLPATLTRKRASLSKTPSRDRDDLAVTATSYIDSITTGVPPRVPTGRPTISSETEDSLLLSWAPARMPSYLRSTPITYIVEERELPTNLWRRLVEGQSDTSFRVSNLRSNQEYMFRVRAQNEFGTSEPTLPVSLYRKSESPPPVLRRSISRTRSTSPRKSISKADDDYTGKPAYLYGTAAISAPTFLRPVSHEAVQYGILSHPVKISLMLQGSPAPNITWYFSGQKLDSGDRYNSYLSPGGEVVLEFLDMGRRDVGEYKVVAVNDEGSAERVVSLEMADPPTFIEPLKDLTVLARDSARMECSVDGIPVPSVKWNKDWRPLSETSRVKLKHRSPDHWTLNIDNAKYMDTGQYEVVAENMAGKVYCSAKLTVEDQIPSLSDLEFREANIEDDYYILEEIGRGRHAIVRKVVEKNTGREFAAKFVQVMEDSDKAFFRNELDNLRCVNHPNVVSIRDAYETPKQLILVSELLTGGEVLDHIVKGDHWTEGDAVFYVKQLLNVLQHMQRLNMVHLDLKPSNILLKTPSSDDITLIDFGFSRMLQASRDVRMNYGTPGFASPEQISNDPITKASDLWAVGVISHVLLTGSSPFQSEDVSETLRRSESCEFSADAFKNISEDAKDFISKLLQKNASDRMSVDECLSHPWIANNASKGEGRKLDISKLREFQSANKAQRRAEMVHTVAVRQNLSRLLDGIVYERNLHPAVDRSSGQVVFPRSQEFGEFLDNQTWYDWHARFEQSPERELSRLRDADRSKAELEELSPSIKREMKWMESSKTTRPTESRLDTKRDSMTASVPEVSPVPIFKRKLTDISFEVGQDVTLTCEVLCPPIPTIAWYHNEELILEGNRMVTDLTDDGFVSLTIINAKAYDTGVYKCVARNKSGRSLCYAKLSVGETPDRPGRPVVTHISANEAIVIWDTPKSDGNSDILYYRVDFRKTGETKWTTGVFTTDESAQISQLEPDTAYRFRISAFNKYGPGAFSWSSTEVTTKSKGADIITSVPELDLEMTQSHQSDDMPKSPTVTDAPSGLETPADDQSKTDVVVRKTSPETDYSFENAVWKGKFSQIKYCTHKSKGDNLVCKIVPVSKESDSLHEYDILHGIRHECIVTLLDCYSTPTHTYLFLQRLDGDNIVNHLTFRRKYTESTVVRIIKQVLSGLQYLHHLGIAHLNLQPSSVLTVSRRHLDIKIVDFSLARKLQTVEGEVFPRAGYPDFMAPEVVTQELTGFAADVWGVGVLAFLLLSGESAFGAELVEDVLANIAYNHYDINDLYENVSQEAQKFIFKILKRLPRNRPLLSECVEHKWLFPVDGSAKSRDDAVFLTNKLAVFATEYNMKRLTDFYRREYGSIVLPIPKPVVKQARDKTVEDAETQKKPESRVEEDVERKFKDKKDVKDTKISEVETKEEVTEAKPEPMKSSVTASEPIKTDDSESQKVSVADSELPEVFSPKPDETVTSDVFRYADDSMKQVAENVVSKAMEEAMHSPELADTCGT